MCSMENLGSESLFGQNVMFHLNKCGREMLKIADM